jgi:transcriptional regulator with XRE-family HTH domain
MRHARIAAGLSVAEAARRAGTSRAAIHSYESGQVSPSLATFERIVAYYGYELRQAAQPRQ